MDIPQFILDKTKNFTGREWVFERINTWLGNDAPQHFLLTGGPGTGKSAISARLVQYCRGDIPDDKYEHLKQTKLVYFHFCQAQDDATIDARSFVIALCKSLVNQVPGFLQALPETSVPGEKKTEVNLKTDIKVDIAEGSDIVGIRIDTLNIGIKSPREAYQHLIRTPLEHLYNSGFHEKLLIIVDGLDESLLMQTETTLVLLLEHGRDLPLQVRYLFISRPDAQVLQSLGEPTLDITRDAPPDVDDVRMYALGRVANLAGVKSMLLAERIAKASEGNFLYTQYVIDNLLQRPDQVQDIETIPFPKGLEGIYREYLKRVWKDSFKKVLGVLAVEKGEGLRRVQIADICGLDESEVEEILSACSQFIHGQQPEGPFHLYHHSFREFLLADKTYQVFPSEAHRRIAEYFLTLYGKDWSACNDTYALQYTPDHLAAALQFTTSPLKQSELKDKLVALLTNYQFIEGKIRSGFLWDLIDDYDTHPQNNELRLIKGALDLSVHALAKDPKHLPSQLYGRLMGIDSSVVRELCNQILQFTQYSWLCPITPSLTPPGGPLLRTFTGHSHHVVALALAPDGRQVISGSHDGTIKVWDLENGLELITISPKKKRAYDKVVSSLAVTPDGKQVISGFLSEFSLTVWDLDSSQEIRTLSGHMGSVNAVAVTPDGKRIVSGSADKDLKIWDLDSGQVIRTLTGHMGSVNAVAVTPDGKRVISGSDDKTLKIWDLDSGQVIRTLTSHIGSVNAVAVTPDGKQVISGSDDETMKIWDLDNGQVIRTITGHNYAVTAIAVAPDGANVVSGDRAGSLKFWNLLNNKEQTTLGGHAPFGIYAVGVTPDGNRVVTVSADMTIKLWDIKAEKGLAYPGHSDIIKIVTVTLDGHQAISGSKDLKIWDLKNGKELGYFPGMAGDYFMALTPDGKRAISGFSRLYKVWEVQSRSEILTLTGHKSVNPTSVGITIDGKRAISESDKTLKIWDLDKRQELFTLTGHKRYITAVAITPDARLAISGSSDQTLKVWDLENGRELYTLIGHKHQITAVAMTPDARLAVSGSEDDTLRVWDLGGGQELRTLPGQTIMPSVIVVTSDGRIAVSGSWDARIKVWDLDHGVIITEFCCDSPVWACAYSEQEQAIIAGDAGGRIYILKKKEGRIKMDNA